MRRLRINKRFESGVATIEFAMTASFFLMMIVAIVAGSHFFFTHNALVESTRRGAIWPDIFVAVMVVGISEEDGAARMVSG